MAYDTNVFFSNEPFLFWFILIFYGTPFGPCENIPKIDGDIYKPIMHHIIKGISEIQTLG